jgi:hypothetical protein
MRGRKPSGGPLPRSSLLAALLLAGCALAHPAVASEKEQDEDAAGLLENGALIACPEEAE